MKTIWQILLILVGLVIVQLILVLVAALAVWPIVYKIGEPISTAVFDFWSMGHLLLGIAIFIFAFTIYFVHKNLESPPEPGAKRVLLIPSSKKMFISWIISVIAAILWEILENTLLLYLEWKNKFDSPLNATTDIILWSIGGLGAWYITHLMFVSKDYVHVYYVYGIITLLVGVFYVLLFI